MLILFPLATVKEVEFVMKSITKRKEPLLIKSFLRKKKKRAINLLPDPETKNSKPIVSHYMTNMKEAKNIYTDEHRHTHTKSNSREKRSTQKPFSR